MTEYAQLFGDRYSTSLLADAAYQAGVDPGPGDSKVILRGSPRAGLR
ncbi:MAG: hypothetical protein V3S60_03750 [Acidimicrobiia bacterium]